MTERTIKQRLSKKAAVETDEARLTRTVELAKESFSRRKPVARMGFFAFCLRQIGFFGWQTWLMQAALLFCLCLGLRLSSLSAIWPLSFSGPFVLRASAVVIVLTALPTLYRSGRYRMLELEISARAVYARLLMSRLALAALGDILMLGGMLGFALLYTDLGLIPALFCLLLPFLAMLAAFLLLLPRVPLGSLPYALMAIGLAMLIATAALGARLPSLSQYPLWGAIGALLIVLCVGQLRALKRQGGFADVQFS